MKRSLLRSGDASLSRREFARAALVAAAAFSAWACGDPSSTPDDGGLPLPVGLNSLGGAPDTPVGHAIAAFVDTVVPGKQRDPTGAIGAIDVGAAALFFDPALPAAQFVGVLVLLLDSMAEEQFGGLHFAEITPDQRDQVLTAALAGDSPVEFAVELAKLAFYSSADAGPYLGYPGANAGYVGDPDFTFGVAMSKEITTDGNLP